LGSRPPRRRCHLDNFESQVLYLYNSLQSVSQWHWSLRWYVNKQAKRCMIDGNGDVGGGSRGHAAYYFLRSPHFIKLPLDIQLANSSLIAPIFGWPFSS